MSKTLAISICVAVDCCRFDKRERVSFVMDMKPRRARIISIIILFNAPQNTRHMPAVLESGIILSIMTDDDTTAISKWLESPKATLVIDLSSSVLWHAKCILV